jgi:vacuolar-type H+-ATPase subunit H
MLTDIRQAEERATATIAAAKEAAEALKKQAYGTAATTVTAATEAARDAKEKAHAAGTTAGAKEAVEIKAAAEAEVSKHSGTFASRVPQVAAMVFTHIVNGK